MYAPLASWTPHDDGLPPVSIMTLTSLGWLGTLIMSLIFELSKVVNELPHA